MICAEELRKQGKAYPRTCAKCGLGPCSRYQETVVIPTIGVKVVKAEFNTRYQRLDNMLKQIKDVIYNYAGEVPVASVLGVLRLVEHDIIRDQEDFK